MPEMAPGRVATTHPHPDRGLLAGNLVMAFHKENAAETPGDQRHHPDDPTNHNLNVSCP